MRTRLGTQTRIIMRATFTVLSTKKFFLFSNLVFQHPHCLHSCELGMVISSEETGCIIKSNQQQRKQPCEPTLLESPASRPHHESDDGDSNSVPPLRRAPCTLPVIDLAPRVAGMTLFAGCVARSRACGSPQALLPSLRALELRD